MPRCPVCGKPVQLDCSPAPPFCSARCRRIDLGRWLDERYGLPVEREDEPEPGDTQRPDEQGNSLAE